MNDLRVVYDVKGISIGLGFLVGKTIVFKDGGNGIVTTIVNSIRVAQVDGHVVISIYSGFGVQEFHHMNDFKNIFIHNDEGLYCAFDEIEENGIAF